MRVAVVGGGPAGLTTALAFAQEGIEVSLFARPEVHPGLWVFFGHTAIAVAEQLDFWDELRNQFEQLDHLRMGDYVFLDASCGEGCGSEIRRHNLTERYGKDLGWAIARAPLQKFLEARVTESKLIRRVPERCDVVDLDGFLDCNGTREGPFDLIVGADGTFSAVRNSVAPKHTMFEGEMTFQGIARLPVERLKPFTNEVLVTVHSSCPFVLTRLDADSVGYLFALPPALVDGILAREGTSTHVNWQGARSIPNTRWRDILPEHVAQHTPLFFFFALFSLRTL